MVTAGDAQIIESLRAGDPEAFASVVDGNHGAMTRFARLVAGDGDSHPEAVRGAWLNAIERLETLAPGTALRPWLYGLLIGQLEAALAERPPTRPAVSPEAFESDDGLWPGHWAADLRRWETPVDRALVERAIGDLPPVLSAIVVLHDVDRLPAEEIERVLGFGADDQRILLHQARSAIRRALHDAGEPPG